MIEGIYHVDFSSNVSNFGSGIAVFKSGSVNGGDHGYLYSGSFSGNGSEVTAMLVVKQWNPDVDSVFGPKKEFQLSLVGAQTPDRNFVVEGNVVSEPLLKITIKGRFLSQVA
jgi:hypothetical protein